MYVKFPAIALLCSDLKRV